MSKEEIKAKEAKLMEMTADFCTQKINREYQELCEKLIRKMGRKREVPFQRGKLEIWAAAVVYTIGTINFLFDKSFEPYMTADEINDFFGTKKSTVSNKSAQIKDMFEIWHFNPEFSTKRMSENNPFNNLVMVDGFIVPLDSIPEEMQQLVKETRARGEDIEFTSKKS